MDDSHKLGHLWVVALGGSNVVWGLVMVVSSVLIYVSLAVPALRATDQAPGPPPAA